MLAAGGASGEERVLLWSLEGRFPEIAMRPFFLREFPCPKCRGDVPWPAEECPQCRRPITASQRFEWLPLWLKPPAFLFMVGAFAFTGVQAAGGMVIVWAMLLGVR
jgi:hypothetical protein